MGGIAGLDYNNSNLENCLNMGNINGIDLVGGIIGNCDSASAANLLNLGVIIGNSNFGAICGSSNKTIKNSYYLYGVCSSGNGGTSKSKSELIDQKFINTLGSEKWKYDSNNINYGYPILSWQTENTNKYGNEYMPNMLGVTLYSDSSDYTSGNIWKNKVKNGNNIQIIGNATKLDDDSVKLEGTSSSYGSVNVGKTYNRTIYVIAKNTTNTSVWSPIFTSAIRSDAQKYALDIFSYKNKITSSSINGDIISDNSSLDYTVTVIVSDAANSNYKFYVNGKCIGTNTAYYSYRTDMMYLNSCYRGNGINFNSTPITYKFLAVLGLSQTEDEIVKNSQWLMNKYNINN